MFQTRNLSAIILILSMLTLSACVGNRTTGFPEWDFNRKPSAPAQTAPGNLSQTPNALPVPEPVQQINYAAMPANKVAILLPLSGQHEDIGNSMLKAAQMALFDIAQENFQLIPYDTKATPEGAKAAAEKAAFDGVNLVLGPLFSGSVIAARDTLRQRNINMIAFSTDWNVTNANTFTIGMLPFDQLERIITYAEQNNLRRIGIIAPDTQYGRSILTAYRTITAQRNIDTIDSLAYAANSNNLSQSLKAFARYNPDTNPMDDIKPPYDAILIAAGGNDAITISSLLTQYGLSPDNVRRLGTGLFDDSGLARQAALKNSAFAAPSPASRKPFENRYVAIYAENPHRLASLAYDATALSAVLASRGMQTTGRPAYDRASITNPNGFAGIDGIFRFLDNGTAQRGLAVLTYKNGNIIEIEPAPRTFQR